MACRKAHALPPASRGRPRRRAAVGGATAGTGQGDASDAGSVVAYLQGGRGEGWDVEKQKFGRVDGPWS